MMSEHELEWAETVLRRHARAEGVSEAAYGAARESVLRELRILRDQSQTTPPRQEPGLGVPIALTAGFIAAVVMLLWSLGLNVLHQSP